MDTFQLHRILATLDRQTRTVFQGVFPRDLMLQHLAAGKRRRHGMYVMNTDCSHRPGQHWIALIVHRRRPLEFFDSYGLPAVVYGLGTLASGELTTPYSNNGARSAFRPARAAKRRQVDSPYLRKGRRLQGLEANTCGFHVVTYLALRARRVTPEEAVDCMAAASRSPDTFVTKFVRLMYGSGKIK